MYNIYVQFAYVCFSRHKSKSRKLLKRLLLVIKLEIVDLFLLNPFTITKIYALYYGWTNDIILIHFSPFFTDLLLNISWITDQSLIKYSYCKNSEHILYLSCWLNNIVMKKLYLSYTGSHINDSSGGRQTIFSKWWYKNWNHSTER